jgi:hypothetical protein
MARRATSGVSADPGADGVGNPTVRGPDGGTTLDNNPHILIGAKDNGESDEF